MDYNNDPKTTFADTQKFFTIIEERIRKLLATQSRDDVVRLRPCLDAPPYLCEHGVVDGIERLGNKTGPRPCRASSALSSEGTQL